MTPSITLVRAKKLVGGPGDEQVKSVGKEEMVDGWRRHNTRRTSYLRVATSHKGGKRLCVPQNLANNGRNVPLAPLDVVNVKYISSRRRGVKRYGLQMTPARGAFMIHAEDCTSV